MVGVLAYVYEEQVTSELQANLNNTFLENYRIVPDKTKAIDSMQMNVSLFPYNHKFVHKYKLQFIKFSLLRKCYMSNVQK